MTKLKELGKVTSVSLGTQDHGVLTLWLNIDFGGSGQGFGGFTMDDKSDEEEYGDRIGHACGTDFILRLLRLFDVHSLEEIVGKPVYAIRDKEGLAGTIIGLETPKFDGGRKFLVEDWKNKWFSPRKPLQTCEHKWLTIQGELVIGGRCTKCNKSTVEILNDTQTG